MKSFKVLFCLFARKLSYNWGEKHLTTLYCVFIKILCKLFFIVLLCNIIFQQRYLYMEFYTQLYCPLSGNVLQKIWHAHTYASIVGNFKHRKILDCFVHSFFFSPILNITIKYLVQHGIEKKWKVNSNTFWCCVEFTSTIYSYIYTIE